ncbi:unnamed protein product [Clavelina lepadiformis]|uniref:Uncharacterized protein n=1 Tax=Clavelina lepadiformis TaxID=159417 RepID=A0ABP0FN94_CLALP
MVCHCSTQKLGVSIASSGVQHRRSATMKHCSNTALRPAKLAKATTKHLDNGRSMGNAAGIAVVDKEQELANVQTLFVAYQTSTAPQPASPNPATAAFVRGNGRSGPTWGTCSVTCGQGQQEQVRRCERGEIGGPGCEGNATRVIPCNRTPVWGTWSDYGECSKTCGHGVETRTRVCCGGEGSREGEAQEERPCNLVTCLPTDQCAQYVNLVDDVTCQGFAKQGYCTSSYQAYMEENCQLTCCRYGDCIMSCDPNFRRKSPKVTESLDRVQRRLTFELSIAHVTPNHSNYNSTKNETLLLSREKVQRTRCSFHVGSGPSNTEAYQGEIVDAKKLFDFTETVGFKFDVLGVGWGFPGNDDAPVTFSEEVVNR